MSSVSANRLSDVAILFCVKSVAASSRRSCDRHRRRRCLFESRNQVAPPLLLREPQRCTEAHGRAVGNAADGPAACDAHGVPGLDVPGIDRKGVLEARHLAIGNAGDRAAACDAHAAPRVDVSGINREGVLVARHIAVGNAAACSSSRTAASSSMSMPSNALVTTGLPCNVPDLTPVVWPPFSCTRASNQMSALSMIRRN
jgi:hypothetical protein